MDEKCAIGMLREAADLMEKEHDDGNHFEAAKTADVAVFIALRLSEWFTDPRSNVEGV